MFYPSFVALCKKKGVSPSRAAQEAGISKASVSKWKQNPSRYPSANIIGKLTRYFDVSVSELLEGDGSLTPEASQPEMSVFYRSYLHLCQTKGVSPTQAATEIGISKAAVSKWKQNPQALPTGTVLAKLANYFGVPTSQLLDPPEESAGTVTDEDIKFALFGGSGEITQEMYEEVRSFAAFVKQREAAKRQK